MTAGVRTCLHLCSARLSSLIQQHGHASKVACPGQCSCARGTAAYPEQTRCGGCACGIGLSARAYAASGVGAFPVCLSITWVTLITCSACCTLPNSLACIHEASTHVVVQELPPNINAAALPEVIDQASGSAVDTPGLRAEFQPSAVAAAPGVPTRAQPGPGVPVKAAPMPGPRARPAPAQADSVTFASVQPGVRRLASSTSLVVAAL